MPAWSKLRITKRAKRVYNRVGGSDVVKRRDAATAFANKHGLTYFHTVSARDDMTPMILGVTADVRQRDSNFCVGTHDGYDMAIVERAADVAFIGFESTYHNWYVLQIDLKKAYHLPFIFIGTKELPKAFYAKVLTSHRDIRHIQFPETTQETVALHGHYAVIASPAQMPFLQDIFDLEVRAAMATHKHPFAVEIEGDSLIVFTEAHKPSEQLLDKLLHYGLWLAKRIDGRVQ